MYRNGKESRSPALFLDELWDGQQGIACFAFGVTDSNGKPTLADRYFEWPAKRDDALAFITEKTEQHNVYYTPLLRTQRERRAATSAPGRCAWVDLDGAEPHRTWFEQHRPWIVESGTRGHLHLYVPLAELTSAEQIAEINRGFAAQLGGDPAPAHAGALMRVPGTLNHKTDERRPVYLLEPPNGFRGHDPAELRRLLAGTQERQRPGRTAEQIPEVIPQGERETQLVSAAGTMRRKGFGTTAILAALERENEERCEPPLEQADLERIASSVGRYAPAEPDQSGDNRSALVQMTADEADRLRARKEAARIVAAEEVSRTWTPPDQSGDLTTLLAQPREPVPHRIDGLGKTGGNTTIVAQYKAGKTTLIQNLARTLVDGVPFLGREIATPLDGNVALWNYELDHDEFVDWLRDIGIAKSDRIHVLTLRGHRHPLVVDHIAEWTTAWLREREIEAWVLDPGARAFSGCGDENSNNDVSVFTEALDVIKNQAGVRDLYMTTHIGRMQEAGQERTRGASRWDDWPDVLWRLGRKGNTRYFSAQGRKVDIEEFELAFDSATGHLDPSGRAGRASAALADSVLWLVRSVREAPGKPKSYWEGSTPGGAKAFRRALADAVGARQLRVEQGSRNTLLLFPND